MTLKKFELNCRFAQKLRRRPCSVDATAPRLKKAVAPFCSSVLAGQWLRRRPQRIKTATSPQGQSVFCGGGFLRPNPRVSPGSLCNCRDGTATSTQTLPQHISAASAQNLTNRALCFRGADSVGRSGDAPRNEPIRLSPAARPLRGDGQLSV